MNMRASGAEPNETSAITGDQVRRFGPPAIIAIAALLFVVQNTEQVKFEFLWFDFEWPMWIMLVVFALVGATVFYGVARRRRRRRRRLEADDERE